MDGRAAAPPSVPGNLKRNLAAWQVLRERGRYAAADMIKEVGRQFNEIKGLREGTAKPDHDFDEREACRSVSGLGRMEPGELFHGGIWLAFRLDAGIA